MSSETGRAGDALRALLVAVRRPRLRPVDLLVALLLAALGFAAAVQVRSARDDGVLASARQEDLVRILDDLSSRDERLRQEIATLTATRARLTSGGGQSQAALQEARRRAQLLGVLAGTLPARGPGILLTISDPAGRIAADSLLDALEELRDAGAEAVQLEGPAEAGAEAGVPTAAVRVVASTSLLDADRGIQVDGVLLRPPYRFTVIGDPGTLASALGIPGGVVDTTEQAAGRALVVRREDLRVAALRPLTRPRYARPAPGGG